MGQHRFFVDAGSVRGQLAELTGAVAHQVSRVLRLHPGDIVELLDNSGFVYPSRIVRVSANVVHAEVLGRHQPATEPPVALELHQALLKGQKMELVLQKGTELGVNRFFPVLSERCVTRPSRADLEGRMVRWQAIVREAAEQSGRVLLPAIAPLESFGEACRTASTADLAVMAWEEERAVGIGRLVREAGLTAADTHRPRVALLVGPEGGFSEREVAFARSVGVRIASLGPRILRAETAALVAPTIVLYEMGGLGG